MSNDHVPEPFRSLLNDLTRNHRAAHAELRDGAAAINRVNRQTMGAAMSRAYVRSTPNDDPEYMTSEEERDAELDAREKTIADLETALEKIVDECDDWDAHHIPLTLVTAVKNIAKDALKKAGRL
jgi:hypothetical protein